MNRKRKMIILSFIIIFIFVVLPIMVGYYNIDKKVPSSEKMNAILYMIFIMTSVYIIPLVIFIIVGISVAKSKFSRLDKNDFVKNQEYYREIINNYSVASLAYIDNFKVDDSILVATLMELERKNIIECKEKIIYIS